MRFYKKDIPGLYLPGIVWNPNTNRQWCSFDAGGGVVDTKDPQLIEALLEIGYPHDEVKEEPKEEVKVVPKTEVEEESTEPEKSEEFFIGSMDVEVETETTEATSPKYKNKAELSKAIKEMSKKELEAYAREEFGVELDRRHNWKQLQKEVKTLGEAALEN